MALLRTTRLILGQNCLYSSLALLFNNIKPTSFQQFSRIKLYYAPSVPFLSCRSGIWILRKSDKKLTSIERIFFRRTAGYTHFDHRRNEEIFKRLKVESVEEKTRR
jgi:hypothetical protein